MKFSIITINYNNLNGLKKTVDSVLCQDFEDFEFIIIDGDSIDGSAEYLVENQAYFSYWVSEPDAGIYDALNKGILASTGDYLFFLNSGDWLYSSEILKAISQNILCGRDIYYGDVMLQFLDREMLYNYPRDLRFSYFFNGTICHQAMIISKKLFSEVGLYNTDYTIISDWEFILKAIFIHQSSYKKLDIVFSNYDMSGVSSQSQNRTQIRNDRKVILKQLFPGFVQDYQEYIDNRNTINKIDRLLGSSFYKALNRPKATKIFKAFFNAFDFAYDVFVGLKIK